MPKGHILTEMMARVQSNRLNIWSVLSSKKISRLFPNTVNLFNKRTSQESVGWRNRACTADVFGVKMPWRQAWEMAQWLNTLTALPEDIGSVPSTYFNFREYNILFWLRWVKGMHVMHIQTCRQQPHAYKIKIIFWCYWGRWHVESIVELP